MNVFDCAMKIEEETKEYFEGLEAESSTPEMKHLFSLLAASEDEYRANLIRLKRMTRERTELDGTVCCFRPHLTQSELLEETENDSDLYLFAVRQEEEEISQFEHLSTRTRDEATARSLRLVAEAERRHLTMMEHIYDYVEAPKHYLASAEFGNLHEL